MPPCHLCGAPDLSVFPAYTALHRVTSDCKPWPPGGQLGVCPRCGAVQAVIDQKWEMEAREIYESYTMYHQGGGAEQSVFDASTGAPISRSSRLLQRLKAEFPFPAQGRLLDIGCGNGVTLRAFHAIAPQWSLAGLEVSDLNKDVVESLPGVEALYTGTLAELPGQFDAIALIHTLEHIAHPTGFLESAWDKLAIDGWILVQVPDCWQNSFMLLVADHATHFFKPMLTELLAASGFEVLVVADDWIAKELTVVARKTAVIANRRKLICQSGSAAAVTDRVTWLESVIKQARTLAQGGSLAIYGTSIAATWLSAELGGCVEFYVDEDPNRAGRKHLGRPIYPPSHAPPGSSVIIALPPALAAGVKQRLDRSGSPLRLYVPDPLACN